MCVYSMIMDYYNPKIPQGPCKTNQWTPETQSEFEKLLDDIRKAAEAAKVVDELTGQPDCVDPEKQKLEKRVAALEKELKRLKKAKKK